LLAAVSIGAGIEPLLVDSAFTVNSLAKTGCASPAATGWTNAGWSI
jgi:hypothetical protein